VLDNRAQRLTKVIKKAEKMALKPHMTTEKAIISTYNDKIAASMKHEDIKNKIKELISQNIDGSLVPNIFEHFYEKK